MADTRRRISYDARANNSNLAYDYNALERRQEQVVRRPVIRTISKPKPSLRPAEQVSVLAVLGFAAVAVLLGLVLMSYVQLTQLSSSVVSLEKQLSTLQTEHVQLTTAYERAFDLGTVESAAAAAGMSKPSPSQIYYLDSVSSDSASVYTPESENVMGKIFSSFGQGFYAVVEYFA